MQPGFASRLRERLKTINQRELARALNTDHSTISNYASGRRRPNTDMLVRLCRALDTSSDWLLGLTDDRAPLFAYKRSTMSAAKVAEGTTPNRELEKTVPTETVHIGEVETIRVPKLRDPIAAGKPILTDGAIDEVHFVRLDWIQRQLRGQVPFGRIVMLEVATSWLGESMVPTIKPGAIIMVDRGQECDGPSWFEPGSVYLVRHEGGVACKRVWKTNTALTCHSDNLVHPPFLIPLERGDLDEIRDHLAAKVFWVGNPVA